QAARMSEMDGDVKLNMAGQELNGEVRYLRVDPDRLAYTTRLLQFEHRQVLDRDRGWALSTAGDSSTLVPSDSTSLESLRAVLEGDVVHLLRAASAPTADPVARGAGTVDGKPCERVEFTAPHAGPVRLSLDPATHRVLGVEGLPTPQGVWRDRRVWSDWMLAEGVWWPKQEARDLDGERVADTIVRKLV